LLAEAWPKKREEMSDAHRRGDACVDERKAHTVAVDSPLDTAALLGVIALIGLIVFLLWT
jgi:hypothetical protein